MTVKQSLEGEVKERSHPSYKQELKRMQTRFDALVGRCLRAEGFMLWVAEHQPEILQVYFAAKNYAQDVKKGGLPFEEN